MVAVMLMSVALIAILCVAAYTLAVYALPFISRSALLRTTSPNDRPQSPLRLHQ